MKRIMDKFKELWLRQNELSVTNPTQKAWRSYFWTSVFVLVITLINKLIGFDTTNSLLFYLIPVLLSASFWGIGSSIYASLLGVLVFDILFVTPFFSVTVHDLKYLISFAVFLLVAIITGTLATVIRNQALLAQKRESRTIALYELSKKIVAEVEMEGILGTVVEVISQTINHETGIIIPEDNNELRISPPERKSLTEKDREICQWVLENGEKAGEGTEVFSNSEAFFLPIISKEGTLGVLRLEKKERMDLLSEEQRRLVEAFANLTSFAIVRLRLAHEARQAESLAQSEKLYNALFNALSHELRTPLSSIMGAVTSLLEGGAVYNEKEKEALLLTINQGAQQMNRLVGNLLDMARLESGMLSLKKDWCDIQELIEVSLRRVKESLPDRQLIIDIPEKIILIYVDFTLIEQVIVNLLDNAIKYSDKDDFIWLKVSFEEKVLRFVISDNGRGIPVADKDKIFDKFYRLKSGRDVAGTGLGLSICQSIIDAHGGKIWADTLPERGSVFTFEIPLSEEPFMSDLSEETEEEKEND